MDHGLEQAGDDLLDRHAGFDQRVGVGFSAKIPHLELILCSVWPAYPVRARFSGGYCSLRAVFSMNVPVPPLHADCM